MPPQEPSQGQPASWDDYIQYEAKRQGISPLLALAVARKESSINPNAVGDGGQAIGMFQLHPGAAKDTGVNRNDPLENIRGGVSYLKQLDTRYKGDVTKILQAYNGGMDFVDKGTVSPAAQAYAAEVIANISQGARANVTPTRATAPVTGRGTATQNVGVQAKQNAIDFTKAYDPRTPEGQVNLAATAASIGGAAMTRGLPVGALTTRIASVIGPVLAAATAGAGTRAVQETIGEVPSTPGSVTSAGLEQGTYELFGQGVAWPIRRAARTLFAPTIASHAAEGLKTETAATRQAGRDMVDSIRTQVQNVAQAVRQSARSALRMTAAGAKVDVAATKAKAAENLANLELQQAAERADIARQYDNLLAQPPSIGTTAGAVKTAVEGPSKRALDLAGERVGEAAQAGPNIDITPMLDRIDEMVGTMRPEIIFAPGEASSAIGFGGHVPVAPRPVGAVAGTRITLDEYKKLVAGKLGVSETHPLPGLLGKIQAIEDPKNVSFAEAHQIKMLLDEAVNWDRVARRHLERISKGARNTLRQVMASAGNQPYEDATAAYRALVPVYRKGIGKQIIQLSQTPDGSAQVARMLKSNDPISARALQNLLVDQSAAGGDAEVGLQAWNAVRSHFTYENLLRGGIEKLGDRVNTLLTERPEFVKVVFGDESGKQILHNLGSLAEAYSAGEARIAEQLAAQKLAGRSAVSTARDTAAARIGAARAAGEQAREAAATQGKQQVRAANRAASEANRVQAEKAEAFKESSLAPYTRRKSEQEAADALRSLALRHTYVGTLSLMRLLKSPRGADIAQWIGYSPLRTRMAVKILTAPENAPAAAAFVKDIYNAFPGVGQPEAK